VTNFDTNFKSKKLLITKIITIMNKKDTVSYKLVFKINYHNFDY